MTSYARAVAELEGLGIFPKDLPKLTPMHRALAATGLARRIPAERNIIVAGTNGKGSVAATLSALLTSAGQRVGLYTSPHLVTTRERIRIDEQDVSEETFAAAYDTLKPVIASEQLTHFEALTLIAAQIFESEAVDWVVWEVGLGGLYDATNAIPHGPCAITRVGIDHEAILGRSLGEIAVQKFGVIGKGAAVVHSPMPPELTALRQETANATGCRWIPARPIDLVGLNRIATPWGSAEMALCGSRAAENTATALTLFESLGFSPDDHLGALAQVRWPGRFSRSPLPGWHCPVYLSGDHNRQGAQSLVALLSQLSWQKLHLVIGIGEDKEVAEILKALCTLPRVELYLTETSFKPLPLSRYPSPFAEKAAFSHPEVADVLAHVREKATAGDLTVVTGSLYLVGKVLSLAT